MNPANCITIIVRELDDAFVAEGCGTKTIRGTRKDAINACAAHALGIPETEVDYVVLKPRLVRAGQRDRSAQVWESVRLSIYVAAIIVGITLLCIFGGAA